MCEDYASTQPGNISAYLFRLEKARQYFSSFDVAQNYKYLPFPLLLLLLDLSPNFTRRYSLEERARCRIWREERLCSDSNGPLLTGRRATFRTTGSSRYALVKHYVHAFRSTLDPLSNGFPRCDVAMRCRDAMEYYIYTRLHVFFHRLPSINCRS